MHVTSRKCDINIKLKKTKTTNKRNKKKTTFVSLETSINFSNLLDLSLVPSKTTSFH